MRKPLRKLGQRVRMGLLSLAIIAGTLVGAVATTAPAEAANSYVYTTINGGSVPMFWGSRNYSGVKTWLPNRSGFIMDCWYDDQNWYGNYWSNRWYLGTSYSGWYGWVHSSQVGNPVGVRRC